MTINAPRVGGIAGAALSDRTSWIYNCVNYGTVGLKESYTQDGVHSLPGSILGSVYYTSKNDYLEI